MRRVIAKPTALVALAGVVFAGSTGAEARGEREDGERRSPGGANAEHRRSFAGVALPITGGPRVSVIVPTRDRPEVLGRCVASILANEHEDFELIVVDQSAMQAVLPADPRVRHIRTETRGKSAALNVGVRAARGTMLAFTDDDCTAPPGWLAHAESLFFAHPELDMAFGALVPMDHDPSKFLVPGTLFSSSTLRIVRGRKSAYVKGGAGANLIARRRLFHAIGEWDELIGPGSRFKACEEWDIYYRALAGGAAVALAPELEMMHWGIRSVADGRVLAWGYSYGEGAVIGKHLRLADFGIVMPTLRILLGDAFDAPRRLWRGQRPGLRSLLWKCRGIAAGARHPVDRDRRVFLG